MLETSLTDVLGCRYPIIQTAMGWVSTPKLDTGSINAGAFGFLAAAVMKPDECENALRQINSQSDQPYGLNLHSFQTGVDQIVDTCIEYDVAALSYGRAPSAKIINKVKDSGIICVPTIGAAKHARKAIDLGADVLVCQGQEGGGHTGETPTWLLLAQVLDLDLGVPVVACGGFKDGRGLAAALTFGADGIAMGTRFLLTSESPTPETTKTEYLKSDVTQIPVSTKLDGLPQRMILNERLRRLEASGRLGLLLTAVQNAWRFKKQMDVSFFALLRQGISMAASSDSTIAQIIMSANAPMIIQQSMVHGYPQDGVLPSGQVAGLIDDLPSCSDLVQEIVADAEMALATRATRVNTHGGDDAV